MEVEVDFAQIRFPFGETLTEQGVRLGLGWGIRHDRIELIPDRRVIIVGHNRWGNPEGQKHYDKEGWKEDRTQVGSHFETNGMKVKTESGFQYRWKFATLALSYQLIN